MASSDCPDLQSRLAELKQLEKQFEQVLDTAAKTGKFEPAHALRAIIDTKVAELRERLVPKEVRELMKSETAALTKFFGKHLGKHFEVPKPSEETMKLIRENLEFWKKNGFELHYLPPIDMKTMRGQLPHWKEPDLQYVKIMDEELKGGWILVDGKQKPQHSDGKQKYDNDSLLESILPQNTRFNLSWNQINDLKPKIAEILKVQPENLRLPKAIEWNIIGNIHHPEWGTTNTSEWFEDLHTDSRARLGGGDSVLGGFVNVLPYDPSFASPDIGFRPFVRFS